MTKRKPPEDPPQTPQEHEDLWSLVTRDVKPLPGRKPPSAKRTGTKEPEKAPKAETKQVIRERVGYVRPKTHLPEAASGIDKRTDDRLKRGKLKIEGRLDLHGFTQRQAQEALTRFVQEAYRARKRCLLVITGKGFKAGLNNTNDRDFHWRTPEPGILKRSVPEWLASAALRGLVLQTHPAQPNDGGEGALYILLRRQRD